MYISAMRVSIYLLYCIQSFPSLGGGQAYLPHILNAEGIDEKKVFNALA